MVVRSRAPRRPPGTPTTVLGNAAAQNHQNLGPCYLKTSAGMLKMEVGSWGAPARTIRRASLLLLVAGSWDPRGGVGLHHIESLVGVLALGYTQ